MATPASALPPLTAEDLFEMPDDDMRHELVAGELRTMSPAGTRHGMIGMRIGARLLAYVDARGLGMVLGTDTGFVLRRNPDTVRAPDAAFVRAERVPAPEVAHKFYEGAPDLAVEVNSPSDSASEVLGKVHEYLATGTRVVWVVDPPTRSVAAYAPDGSAHVYLAAATIDGGDVLPGFTCPVAEFFGPPASGTAP